MITKELIQVLSTAFQKESDSNNYKLLATILQELEIGGYGGNKYGEYGYGEKDYIGLEDVLQKVQEAHWIDYATDTSLENFAQLFNITRNTGETDAHFRMRIKLQYQKYTSHSTTDEIKKICAVIMETTTERIMMEDVYPAMFDMTLFQQDLSSSGVSSDEFKTLVNEIKPAAVQIRQIIQLGTFECMKIGGKSDSEKGYNDISGNNPGGGTYAGLI
jgi:hypothetical protein